MCIAKLAIASYTLLCTYIMTTYIHCIFNPRTVILAAVPNDPIVSKDYPANVECIRTKDHKKAERMIAQTDKLVVYNS